MNASTLIKSLNKKFPQVWTKRGLDWDGNPGCLVWSGEGSIIDGMEAFDMYNPSYDGGVHPELAAWAESKGCYWEAYDSGTFFLYKN